MLTKARNPMHAQTQTQTLLLDTYSKVEAGALKIIGSIGSVGSVCSVGSVGSIDMSLVCLHKFREAMTA